MVILDADHPDTPRVRPLEGARGAEGLRPGRDGYDLGLNGDAWRSIQFQNANNSVRLTDDFFRRVEDGEDWQTRTVAGGEPADEIPAAELLREISEAAWVCGDPGVQYEDTIQRWHTSPNAGRISGSNPCSEYMHIDDSACNLASINLHGVPRRRRDVRAWTTTATRSGSCSPPRRSSSRPRATRRSGSATTRAPTASSAWATPTSARC